MLMHLLIPTLHRVCFFVGTCAVHAVWMWHILSKSLRCMYTAWKASHRGSVSSARLADLTGLDGLVFSGDI